MVVGTGVDDLLRLRELLNVDDLLLSTGLKLRDLLRPYSFFMRSTSRFSSRKYGTFSGDFLFVGCTAFDGSLVVVRQRFSGLLERFKKKRRNLKFL